MKHKETAKGRKLKYCKASAKYFFDKGPYLMLIGIVPSLLLPFLLSPSSSLYQLFQYDFVAHESFGTLYLQMRSLPYEFWYIGIVGLILMVIAVALLFGTVDRHMRVGEFSLSPRNVKTRLNENIVTSILLVVFMCVVFELINLLTTALYYLWAVVFTDAIIWLVFSIISFLFMSLLLLFVFSSVIIWPPFMLHTGLKVMDAFRMGWRQLGGKVVSTMFSLAAVVIPFQLIMIITGALDCGIICRTVLDGLSYALVIPYYVTLMYNIFYDVTGTERADLSRVDIWKDGGVEG